MAEEKSAEAIRDRNRKIREEAADKRRSRRESERRRAQTAKALDATEIVDDALARSTHAVGTWLKRHFNKVQWLLVLGIAGGIGWQVYKHRRDANEGKATDSLMAGVHAEFGFVGSEAAERDPISGIESTLPRHASDEARLKAAASAYQGANDGDVVPTLADIGLAGVLLDQGKNKEALAEYKKVRESKLASEDSDLRARAAEGMGFAHEALGELDAARKAFRELESSDSAALSALGLYHQARLDQRQGNLEKAKENLNAALKKLETNKTNSRYLESVVRELLADIDPSTAAAMARPQPSEAELRALREQLAKSSGGEMTEEQIEEFMKSLSSKPAPAPQGSTEPEKPAPAPSPAPSGEPAGAP